MEQSKKPFIRKHVFINRKLQGHYMLTFLIPMLIMLAFFCITLYFGIQSIMTTTITLIKKDVENSVSMQLQDNPNPSVDNYRSIIDEIKKNLGDFAGNIQYRNGVLLSLLWIFGIGLLLVIIQTVLLTVFFSHRLAGPIYRLEKSCHMIIDGDYTDEIHLRKEDEMKNLAMLFNESVKMTNNRIVALRDAHTLQERETVVGQLKL